MDTRRVIIDTDTAGDDTQALLLAALSERIDIEAVTICAGNVDFDDEVRNAKYTLQLAGHEDVPVYEGARSPLLKDYRKAEYVHGEGGLGGRLDPDVDAPSGDGFAPDRIVDLARENPGELTLVCIAPLTNVALALQREPDLNELLDEVWVMGGNVNCLGNVTPAAEYNFWVDPDAAKIVIRNLDTALVDWGLTLRDSMFESETLAEIEAAADESEYAEFYATITESVREFNRETLGKDATTQPDSLVSALLIAPDLVEREGTYFVEVDEREGMTRGYTMVDEDGVTDGEPSTRVIESVNEKWFRRLFLDAVIHGDPDRSLD
ncbi:nucleoside hydrolase [Halobacteriales archaeon SW_7_65_23]|nr:MAG: nucleoside hydrolase [Halobacteriales archaeon SW_7_65_23]